jgi:threonine synthase
MARFKRAMPVPDDAVWVGLGEGATPLLSQPVKGRSIYLKCEHLNPTGSFKDRGAAVLVSALAAAGVMEAFDDSSGNAGAAFAAYAARANITAHVLVPSYASGPKRNQIEAYGAKLVAIDGPRSAVTEAAVERAASGEVYASHAALPHVIAGNATIAFEIFEQLGNAPGGVITPVGQGTLLLGLAMGFQSLLASGHIQRLPALFGVQAQACAPIADAFAAGDEQTSKGAEGQTLAEGIRITTPYRANQVLRAVRGSKGAMLGVDESQILPARDALAGCGLYVEPTSAVVWPALTPVLAVVEDPVVAILTGSGLKFAPST